ncbi:MAG: hypothetical protein AB7Q29_05070 [Vicinamibacterales bacterium]
MKQFLTMLGVAALLGTAAATAQQHDPDKMMGGGSLPAGWSVRLDNGSTKPDGVNVMPMGGGMHFRSGPAGIYYRPTDTKSGNYEVRASFNQVEPAAHPEAYGLFIGGSDLAGAGQKYTYFLVRQDGKFLIKRRNGTATPNVVDWKDSPAVKKTDASMKGTNVLAIKVADGTAHFLINDTEVHSAPVAQVDASGIAGMRINHNLNVHVDGFSVK